MLPLDLSMMRAMQVKPRPPYAHENYDASHFVIGPKDRLVVASLEIWMRKCSLSRFFGWTKGFTGAAERIAVTGAASTFAFGIVWATIAALQGS